jgi:hypothetical protein
VASEEEWTHQPVAVLAALDRPRFAGLAEIPIHRDSPAGSAGVTATTMQNLEKAVARAVVARYNSAALVSPAPENQSAVELAVVEVVVLKIGHDPKV